jgi:hypothetical protein
MKQTIQKLLNNETLIAILLILLTTVLTYGLSISRLGFYHDDWYMLWSGEARGAQSIIPLFSTDRPFMGVVYSYVYRLLGDAIANWHWYALLWRFIGGLGFFWILRLLWPREKYITTLMAVLFIVYPGFLSQPNANTKQNHLYGFGTALLSIAFTLEAMKTNRRGWKIFCYILSILLTANYLWIYEYMIGFEGTRLVIIGYALYQKGLRGFRKLAVETLKIAWPYLLVTAVFLYWRIFVFEGSRNATDAGQLAGNYLGDLRYMSIRLLVETAKDFLNTSVFAWFVMPYQLIASALYSDLGIALLIAGLVIGLVFLYMFLYRSRQAVEQQEGASPNLVRDLLCVGGLTVLCAVAPVILSGRNVELYDAYKSYGLHPIPGVILFITGLVLMIRPKFRSWVVVALIGVSVATQVLNADNWARYWEYQRQMWWQLTWRAPDIQNDTLVMTYSDTGFNPEQDYELWGPLNLIYRPGLAKAPAIQAEVLNSDTVYNVLKGEVKNNKVRDIRLHRDFNNLLLLSMSPVSSCLHVIDGTLPVYSENETLLLRQVGAYSHVDRIVPQGTAPVPPATLFESEPAHGWCYYYQKASLARQRGDWEEIGNLYDQVHKLNLETDDKSEMIPFLEGLVNLGRVEDARTLFQEQIKGNAKMRLPLCASLAQDPGYPADFGYDYQTINAILCRE